MNPQDERHEALLQKYDLVSKLLTAEPVENEKLKEFRTLFKGDFMAFANGESSLAEEASALDKLRIVESRLEEVVAFPPYLHEDVHCHRRWIQCREVRVCQQLHHAN